MNKDIKKLDLDKMTPEEWKRFGITREQYEKMKKEAAEREKQAPSVGTIAPDFEIKRLSDKGKLTEGTVKLSVMRGRPVAIVFGSYT